MNVELSVGELLDREAELRRDGRQTVTVTGDIEDRARPRYGQAFRASRQA